MVSITVGQFIADVAEELEVTDSTQPVAANGTGGSLTPYEQASMIRRLQRLIDSSNVQRPQIFAERMDLLTLTANTQVYLIGIDPNGVNTANFPIPRPTKIDRANLLLSPTVRIPVDILSFKQWAAIRYQQIASPPRGIYYDNGFGGAFEGAGLVNTNGTAVTWVSGAFFSQQMVGQPFSILDISYPVIAVANNGTALTLAAPGAGVQVAVPWSGAQTGFSQLYCYPIPDQPYGLELYSMSQNGNVAQVSDYINYPPGYADFWLYSMVVRCSRMFGRAASPEHIELLRKATETIGSANCVSPEISSDVALVPNDSGLYNWLSGTSDLD